MIGLLTSTFTGARVLRAGVVAAATLVVSTVPLVSVLPAQSGDGSSRELPELHDLTPLREAFNAEAGTVRLLALLSPTCAYCLKGYRYMRRLLDEIPDERLRMYVVWEPMLSADTRAIAARQARRTTDPRMAYQAWDGGRVTGAAWQEVMGYSSTAWDVYYLYGPGQAWDGAPPEPDYWQHQFEGPRELRLHYDRLKARILAMLARDR